MRGQRVTGGGAVACVSLASSCAQLTASELPVLVQLLKGASNKEIAQELGCSVRNVEFHVSNILRKFGQSTRARLLSAHNHLLMELPAT